MTNQGKEFGKAITKRLEVLVATAIIGIGATAVAYQAEIIGGVNSDEPTVDCVDDYKEVFIPQGGSWYQAAESVDMGPGVLQGDVAEVIANINGTHIAPADEFASVPVSCETAD